MANQDEDKALAAHQTQAGAEDAAIKGAEDKVLMEEAKWNLLLGRIQNGRCTPFIGGEACSGMNQFRSEIVRKWAEEFPDDPFKKIDDLPRAAQFVALKQKDWVWPKEQIVKELKKQCKAHRPDFNDPSNVYSVLARLPFPVYITTNYHNFMEQALQENKPIPRDANVEFCRWNEALKDPQSIFETDYKPTPANPVVFHLYGHMNFEKSLVLTEDDYFDFLVNVSEVELRIPPRIQEALANTSLLFLGYRIFDWDFRVLFRIVTKFIKTNPGRYNVGIQIEPAEKRTSPGQKLRIRNYLKQYFEKFDIQVYWMSCQEFAAGLSQRWEKFPNDR